MAAVWVAHRLAMGMVMVAAAPAMLASCAAAPATQGCRDDDADGYGAPPADACQSPVPDCDDTDGEVHPDAEEQCDGGRDDDCDGQIDEADIDCQPPLFSFVALADPHITTSAQDNQARLAATVDWINDHRADHVIELVIILGDIGWGEGGAARAKELLDALTVPYVPVIGDNEIQLGSEQDFDTVFSPHYEGLAAELEGWSRATPRVYNPVIDDTSYLQNLSFSHRGVHFMGVDWCTRTLGAILGEQAELHDFPGGTWPWFVDELEQASTAASLQESIVMASHHPMYPMEIGAFSESEYAAVAEVVEAHAGVVYASFAGHFHNDVHHVMPAGFELFLTDATWDDENTLRLVGVRVDGERLKYRHQLVIVP